jgi:ribosome modulation factor
MSERQFSAAAAYPTYALLPLKTKEGAPLLSPTIAYRRGAAPGLRGRLRSTVILQVIDRTFAWIGGRWQSANWDRRSPFS